VVEPKDWTHPADSELASKTKERNTQFKYSQTEARMNTAFVSGAAIYIQNELKRQMKNKLHDRCTNNQAE